MKKGEKLLCGEEEKTWEYVLEICGRYEEESRGWQENMVGILKEVRGRVDR